MEEEGNDFFDQIIQLLLLLKSKTNDNAFYEAIWDVALDIPSQRLSVFQFIQYQTGVGRSSNVFPLIPNDKAILAIGESMLDMTPLVVRHALEFVLKNVPLDESRYVFFSMTHSSLSLADRHYLVRQMLMVLLHKDLSLSRRVFSWISPIVTSMGSPQQGMSTLSAGLGQISLESDSTTGSSPQIDSSLSADMHSSMGSSKLPSPLPSIQLLLDVLEGMLRELLEAPTPKRNSYIFFRVLVSLLDKEELNEPLAHRLLLPLIHGLERIPLLIEESSPFFELLDIHVIWDIFITNLFEQINHSGVSDGVSRTSPGVDVSQLVCFALSSISTLCDEECANEILPKLLLSLASHLNADLLPSLHFGGILRLMNAIITKIPERCLNERDFANDVVFGQQLLSHLIPFQRTFEGHYSRLSSCEEGHCNLDVEVLIEVTQHIIEWTLVGILKKNSLSSLCFCGCDEVLDADLTTCNITPLLNQDMANELAIHLLEFGLNFNRKCYSLPQIGPVHFSLLTTNIRVQMTKIAESALRVLPMLWRFVSKKEECAAIISLRLPHIWAIFIDANQNLLSLSPEQLILDTRNVCHDALWTLSHLSSTILDAQLPTIQGRQISALDLFFSRYLHEDHQEEPSFSEKVALISKFWIYKKRLSHLRIAPMEEALPWTVLRLLEHDGNNQLIMEALVSPERSETLFEFLVAYFEHIYGTALTTSEPLVNGSQISAKHASPIDSINVSTNTPRDPNALAMNFSMAMALNLLERIESLLKNGPINQFAAMQLFYGPFSCLGLSVDATQPFSCGCTLRPLLRLLRALVGISTTFFDKDNQSHGCYMGCDSARFRLTALRVSLSLLVFGSEMINGDSFMNCPAVHHVLSTWMDRLMLLINNELDIEISQATLKETLCRLSAVLTLCLCFPTLRPTAWMIEGKKIFLIMEADRTNCTHPIASLVLKWIHSPVVEMANIVELLEFTFSFWGASVLSRWSFFLPLLGALAQQISIPLEAFSQDQGDKSVKDLSCRKCIECFWRIVDFLTGGYQVDGGIKFINSSSILHGYDSEVLERGSLEQDVLLLSYIHKALSITTPHSLEHMRQFSIGFDTNGRILRHLSFLSLPGPFLVLPLALAGSDDTSRILPILLRNRNNASSTTQTKFAIQKGIELVKGTSELYRDLFLVPQKNSLLASAFGSHQYAFQGNKPSTSLSPLQQVGIAPPTEATLLGIIEHIIHEIRTSDNGENDGSDDIQILDAIWGQAGLGIFCKDVFGMLSKRRPSFAATISALISLLATLMAIGRQTTGATPHKFSREISEIFVKLFEQASVFVTKSSSGVLESVLLSEMVVEGILLFPTEDGIVTVTEQESMITSLMGNYLMPGIRTALAVFQRTGAPVTGCSGGRCAGHPGCLGNTNNKIRRLGSFNRLSNKIATNTFTSNPSNSGEFLRVQFQAYNRTDGFQKIACERTLGGGGGELHIFLTVALLLIQRMPSSASFAWRRELLESLFLETNVRFFALPLYHQVGDCEDGNRCWCLRRALVAMMSSSLMTGGSNSLGDGTAVEILTGRNKSSSSTSASSSVSSTMSFFSTLLGRSSSATAEGGGSYLGSPLTASLEPSSLATIRAVRRLAYAMLSASSTSSLLFASPTPSSLFLPQIHEKVAELFRVVRSMDHYQVEATTSATSQASLLMDALFLLFRVLVLRFERTAMQNNIGSGHVTSSSTATSVTRGSSGDTTTKASSVLLNNTSMLLAWWPTLNAELLYYIGKISGLIAKEKDDVAKSEAGTKINTEQRIDSRSEQNPKSSHGRLLFRRSARQRAASVGARDRLDAAALSDLVSICKLLELLLKSGVEELRLHSWWLFGPTGALAPLAASLLRIAGEDEMELMLEPNEVDAFHGSSPIKARGLSICKDTMFSITRLSCFDTQGTPLVQLASFLHLATKGWCLRGDKGIDIFNETRTSDYHCEYVEFVEHFLLEEEFSALEGGGPPTESACL